MAFEKANSFTLRSTRKETRDRVQISFLYPGFQVKFKELRGKSKLEADWLVSNQYIEATHGAVPGASMGVPTHDKAMWKSSGGQGEPELEGCPSGPA